nr:TetR/AcrR family transcriptional regulator [Geodermatophilus normandii]
MWTETIEGHRRAVHDAALDATAALVVERGLASVTMSAIAEQAGIGRATLYKYFPDVDAVLTAWHERQVERHLAHLVDVADRAGSGRRLEAVLLAYAALSGQHDGSGPAMQLHRGEHVAHARRRLHAFVRDLLAERAEAGELRGDVPADELAGYVLGALSAAGGMPSEAAVRRLVTVTLAGLRPPGRARG